MDTYWFSKKTFEQLQVKYETLQFSKKEQYDLLNQVIQMDHSSDNLTEEFLKYKEIQKTLQQLDEVIQHSKIIEDSPTYQKRLPNEVHVGTIVTLQFNEEELYEYTIVGYGEGDLQKNHLSYTTNLAQAILKRKINECFFFVQNGFEHRVKILDVKPQLN
ncbi:GreA/GreB family elongation factor [Kurthia sp. FSL E2-0154]|uniref:GreA/GreB family elongation factor n=1 Tax=Kurthia sp. FSL E2-0154 TaxID=2921358 RepID=UPI0030F91982